MKCIWFKTNVEIKNANGVTILQVSRFTDNMINGTQGWGMGMGHSLSPQAAKM